MKIPAAASIKVGKIVFPIWRLGDGRVAFDYREGTKRKIVARKKFGDLQKAAADIALKLLNGETEALQVTPQDCRIHVAARAALDPLGLPVDAMARDVAWAHKLTNGATIRDLALFYKRHHTAALVDKTVAEVIAAMRAEKLERNLSSRWTRDITNDSKRIADKFGERLIADVSSDELLEFLRELQKERGFEWKRRNHLRNMAVVIWRWAQSKTWLPSDRLTAAEVVPRIHDPLTYRVHATYTPIEMRAWIANISDAYRPWLLVCGFAPVRSEEVAPDPDSKKDPFRYEDLNWKRRLGTVRPETAKVRGEDRVFPISDQLFAWAESENWFDRAGPICPGVQPSKRETARLSRITGAEVDGRWVQLKWKRNALRKTFISAMLGLTDEENRRRHSRAQIAEICGTSEAQIKKTYKRTLDPEQAAAWVSILPSRPANVIEPHLFARM